jgi:hypothetical protein
MIPLQVMELTHNHLGQYQTGKRILNGSPFDQETTPTVVHIQNKFAHVQTLYQGNARIQHTWEKDFYQQQVR